MSSAVAESIHKFEAAGLGKESKLTRFTKVRLLASGRYRKSEG
jgi:hypothetical protein